MNNFRKTAIFFISFILLTFTGCFGGGDDETSVDIANFETYNAPSFSISVPRDWVVLEPKDFSGEIPPEIQVAFRDNVKDDIFTSNANISKELLQTPMTSYDFAKSVIQENKNTLLNYKEITRDDEFNIVIGGKTEETILIMFEGKQSEEEPTIRLIQTYAVNGADAYTITAGYLQESDEFVVDAARNIVKSFKIK